MTEFQLNGSVTNPAEVLEIFNELDNNLGAVESQIESLAEDDLIVELKVSKKVVEDGQSGEVIIATIKDK